jgi:hypothetical protein
MYLVPYEEVGGFIVSFLPAQEGYFFICLLLDGSCPRQTRTEYEYVITVIRTDENPRL